MDRCNDYVTRSELNNYFKKIDLFSGLSSLEKTQARQNLGILNYTNNDGSSNAIEIQYEALLQLKKGNSLAVGGRYIITDFCTSYEIDGITYKSSVIPLVVLANTNSSLDTRVFIKSNPSWQVEYTIDQTVHTDGVKDTGHITYLQDDQMNTAFYDFKNIKFRRTKSQLASSNLTITTDYIDLYTFSDIVGSTAVENSNIATTHSNYLDKGCTNNVFIGDTYNNKFDTNCINNTFLNGCHDNYIQWDSSDNMFNETVCYLYGAINNKTFLVGNNALSSAISKQLHKVNSATIISYLDPTTYTYQVLIL